jgi:hypothetical protein
MVKIFDLRSIDKSSASNSKHDYSAGFPQFATRAAFGISIDPFNSHRFAAFTDDISPKIMVWDTRWLVDPVLSLETQYSQLTQASHNGFVH